MREVKKESIMMTNKERLKEVIAVVKSQKEAVRKLSHNDLKWLIKQAERVEELENNLNGTLYTHNLQAKRIWELEEENEQLKADINAMENEIVHGNKSIEFETYRKCVRGEIDEI